jgi:hypothetical protein
MAVLSHSIRGRSLIVERYKSLRSRPVARPMIPMAPFVAKLAGCWVYLIGELSDPDRPLYIATRSRRSRFPQE